MAVLAVKSSVAQLTDFASRYATAWSSQNPQGLVSFYAKNGSITMNAGTPAVGRAAIAAKAGEFMTAFPNMIVKMDSVSLNGSHATFHADRKKYGPWRHGQARSNQPLRGMDVEKMDHRSEVVNRGL